jgi:hypothetical protein
MITGNKGEWSEAYVFLKLLADGKLYAADENLEKINDIFYPIIRILREELGRKKRSYVLASTVTIFDDSSGEKLLDIPISKFVEQSHLLLKTIKDASGRSFSAPEIEAFLKEIDVLSLKSYTGDKSDIKVIVHDIKTHTEPLLGFSIKSMLGHNATLFNPGNGTNFIYEITGPGASNLDIEKVNSVVETPKIASRIELLRTLKCELNFVSVQSETLELNLKMIDSDLPKILAQLILYKYTSPVNHPLLESLITLIETENPLKYNLSSGHPLYRQRIKNFLTDSAMGMTPEHVWEGNYSATGGILIVKKSGELVCYHIYNRSEFQNYLLTNTRMEQPSTSRHGFGEVYSVNGKKFIKLNLQIRFIN